MAVFHLFCHVLFISHLRARSCSYREISSLELSISEIRKKKTHTPLPPCLPHPPFLSPLSLITSLLLHSPSHVLLMYLWNYWNVNVPLLPLIFKTKGYRCAYTDTGPTGNREEAALISFFVTLQRVPPPSVFFWISLVHPSSTSLPFFTLKIPCIYNGTARRTAEGWATINGTADFFFFLFRFTARVTAPTADCVLETKARRRISLHNWQSKKN